MSRTHYTVNDDVYGKILKTHSNLKPQTDYAEVFEACEGLGKIYPELHYVHNVPLECDLKGSIVQVFLILFEGLH